ncbi:hypothetical protein [Oceanobacillus sp. FSL K6-0251]|uniref:hypothetical protein n=1 Tax=Oceanobacillus sp. FSL K6-0251 TaxID=2921602 RepID=UPI0030F920FB
MSWTKEFLDSLKQWDEETPDKKHTINDIVAWIGMTIGAEMKYEVEEWTLDYLEERIRYLVDEVSIDEQFLIDSLINVVTERLKNYNAERGENIVREEKVIKEYEKEGMEVPTSAYERLERLKSDEDIMKSNYVLSVWESIISINFSLINRKMMISKEAKASYEKHKSFFDSLPEKDKDKTIGELVKKSK